MPVNMDVTNSIIRAFQLGQQQKLQREELDLRRKTAEEEKKLREQQQAEQIRQFNEQQKRLSDQFEATNKIAQGQAKLQELEGLSKITEALEAGRYIPGVSKIATAKIGENQLNTFQSPDIRGGEAFSARDPMTAARQTAEMQEQLIRPKTEAEIRIRQAQEAADRQSAKLLEDQRFEHQKSLRQLTEDSREKIVKYQQSQANYRASLRSKNRTSDSQARIIATAHDNNPVTKRAFVANEAVSFANSLDINTKSPADDIGLIYAFAKAMDPESTVREGEYATVQKYSQSWKDQFGFSATRILNNTEFLTPEARNNLKRTIQTRANATLGEYKKYRSTIANRLSKAGATPDYLGEDPGVSSSTSGKSKVDKLYENAPIEVKRDPKTGKLIQ